jgi:hypothetical protein
LEAHYQWVSAVNEWKAKRDDIAAELQARTEECERLSAELVHMRNFAPRCRDCGKACEPERWV